MFVIGSAERTIVSHSATMSRFQSRMDLNTRTRRERDEKRWEGHAIQTYVNNSVQGLEELLASEIRALVEWNEVNQVNTY